MTIKQIIHKEFKCSGLKQTELSELTGISSTELSLYFNKDKDLGGKNIEKLLKALGLDIVKLFKN